VRWVPDSSYDLFAYGGRYYVHDSGNWFVASDDGGPWAPVTIARVPRSALVVPARYYKHGAPRYDRRDVPPGHRKHRGRGHGHHDD